MLIKSSLETDSQCLKYFMPNIPQNLKNSLQLILIRFSWLFLQFIFLFNPRFYSCLHNRLFIVFFNQYKCVRLQVIDIKFKPMQQEAPFKPETIQSQNQMSESLPTEKQLKHESQVSEQSQLDQKPCFTLKVKILIGIGILLILLGVGLGVGLYFRMRTTIEPFGPSRMVSAGNNSYVKIQSVQVKEKNFMSEDVSVKVMVTQALKQTTKRSQRLLQSESSKSLSVAYYNIHAISNEIGCQVSLTSDNKLEARVNPEILANYVIKNQATDVNSTDDQTDDKSVANFTQQLNDAFIEAFGNEYKFNFTFVQALDLAFNDSTSKYEFTTNNKTGRRMLIVRNLGWLKKLGKSIMKTVKRVLKPVVKVIKKYGPQIGCAVGTAVAGKIGCEIGSSIGSGIKSFLNACVPSDTLKIKCTTKGVTETIVDNAIDGILGSSVIGKVKNQVQFQNQVIKDISSEYNKMVDKMGTSITEPKNQNQQSYGQNGGAIQNQSKNQNQQSNGTNSSVTPCINNQPRYGVNSGAIAGIPANALPVCPGPKVGEIDNTQGEDESGENGIMAASLPEQGSDGATRSVKSHINTQMTEVSLGEQISSSYFMVSTLSFPQTTNSSSKTSGDWSLLFAKERLIVLLAIWLLLVCA